MALSPANMAALRELAEDLESIVKSVSTRDGDATARQHLRADAVRAAIAALADYDDRRRAAQHATWQRAAHVVDYYTGRDLDLMDEEYTKETAR